MAQSAKDDLNNVSITRDQLQTTLAAIKEKQQKASELQGQVGKMTAVAVDKYGMEKNALTIVRRLANMDESKRHSVLKGIIEYADKAGFFDGMDTMDAIFELMEQIVTTAKKVGHNSVGA